MRFRKRVKVFPGFHVNLSTRGVSTTIGPKGASVNIGKRGAHLNVGIPGSGISHRQKLGKTSSGTGSKDVRESWITPAGNPRNSPTYEIHIRNEYLRKERLIKGKDPQSIQRKANDQLEKWQEQENKQRLSRAKADAIQRAEDECEFADQEIKERIEALESILLATLRVDDRINWNELMDRRPIPSFVWDGAPPARPAEYPLPELLKPSFFEWLISSLKQKRLAKDQEARDMHQHVIQQREVQWQQAHDNYTQRYNDAKAEHHADSARFLSEQQRRNTSIQNFQKSFESGNSKAIVEYVTEVFERSEYPEGLVVECQVAHDSHSETIVIDVLMLTLDDMPMGDGYKFIKSRQESKLIAFKKGVRERLYDSVLKLIILRTVHEAFESLYTDHVKTIVVNGSVTALNGASGHDETSCIISMSANRTEFEALNLARIDPSECVKQLQGLVAGPLSKLIPVKPIMRLNRIVD